MYVPNNQSYSFYYDMKNHCSDAFMVKPNGEIMKLHGVIINKLCDCKQGVEVRLHATEAELEGAKENENDNK